ncbi:MAG: CoA ester lyase [Deltaproteobacteria bacterium]|nr:CoA ester lyase [Deltaproteobacteria bacterium]
MTTKHRPRRSVLYMPGANARALEKARTLPADSLILDLEDAVAPDMKETARDQVIRAVEAGGYGRREVMIRTNGLNTPWGYDDLVAAAKVGPDAVLLPKVESAETVRQAESVLQTHGAAPDMAIWCMMETPRAMLHAEEIADASPRLGGLVMGTSDLAKDLQAQHTAMRLPLITALGLCLLAARAARLVILDAVFLDLNDQEGFIDSCRQGAELGFDGKTLIHPKQLEAANEVFAPSKEELRLSRRIIGAYAEAEAEGKGVVVVDGKLIERLHVDHAKRVVALAEAIAG